MLRVWLKEYLQEEKTFNNKSENTLRAYKKDIQQLLEFLDKFNLEIKQIKDKHIKDYLLDLKRDKISKRSINRKLSSIKSYFRFLERKEYIKENPSEYVDNIEFERIILPIFSVKDILKIREAYSEEMLNVLRDRLIVEILYSSGIRATELLNLSEGLFNFEAREIKVTGKSERIVFYSKTCSEVLHKYLEAKRQRFGDDYRREVLFVNSNQGRLSDRSLRRIVDKILRVSKIDRDLSPHSLRHSFGAYMVYKGMNLHYLQELMGHTSIESTKLYLDYDEKSIIG
ncbi:MAG: tyrosine-type recombinase/integrase [Fusobacteriaceae bacterium]|nr:tyrosine-type recombinase/integrase [Fusobacteriaceae bacterium]